MLQYTVAGVIVCRQIFCDFGDVFTVADTDGEQPTSVMVAGITKVTITTHCFHGKCHNNS